MAAIRRTLATATAGLALASLPAGPARAVSWQLIDYQQKTCYVSTRGDTNYYGIWISGSWTHRINVGASALPVGASYTTSYAPIPAGSSDGVGSLAYVDVTLPVGAAAGVFTASMWASDGSTTEAVPITLVVNATSCRHY